MLGFIGVVTLGKGMGTDTPSLGRKDRARAIIRSLGRCKGRGRGNGGGRVKLK